MTLGELWRIGGDQPCNKNELRRNVLCFIFKEPWGPNHSWMGDTEEMTRVDQEKILYDFEVWDYSLDESMDSYEGTF